MKTPDQKPKTSVFGTLLLVAGTAAVTVMATKNADKIVAGFKAFAQHMADGKMTFPPAKGMNGSTRSPAPATDAGH